MRRLSTRKSPGDTEKKSGLVLCVLCVCVLWLCVFCGVVRGGLHTFPLSLSLPRSVSRSALIFMHTFSRAVVNVTERRRGTTSNCVSHLQNNVLWDVTHTNEHHVVAVV